MGARKVGRKGRMKKVFIILSLGALFWSGSAHASVKHCKDECGKNLDSCRKGCLDAAPTCDSNCVDVNTACLGCCVTFDGWPHCY